MNMIKEISREELTTIIKNNVLPSFASALFLKERDIDEFVTFHFLNLKGIYVFEIEKERMAFVKKQMLEVCDITEYELSRWARKNLMGKEFVTLPISDLIGCERHLPMYVLSTDEFYRGSNVLLRMDVLKQASEMLGGDMILIPSSIHEIIAISKEDVQADEINEMVKMVNSNEVPENDVLGNEVYLYEAEDGVLKVY